MVIRSCLRKHGVGMLYTRTSGCRSVSRHEVGMLHPLITIRQPLFPYENRDTSFSRYSSPVFWVINVRPIASETAARRGINVVKLSGVSDCAPSEAARSGSG